METIAGFSTPLPAIPAAHAATPPVMTRPQHITDRKLAVLLMSSPGIYCDLQINTSGTKGIQPNKAAQQSVFADRHTELVPLI
ncbi:MAG: hypothetical protein LBV45_01030 [Xanthomonadaceae bacterium]|nr:hypothetical protein [Xanthomonadaceae bacterium]